MGPLLGHRIIEIAGIGPGPYCAMLLADMGAEVVRVVRPGPEPLACASPSPDLLSRGRRSVRFDLKRPEAVAALLRMIERADALLEGFRPGVMERLGLGPETCLTRNPGLVYGRVTGFGQDGPLARAAGHDINYIALAGVLAHIGRRGEPPTLPLNLLGDFAAGGLFLAFGVVCALLERVHSGAGQVVDATMLDGAASLMTFAHAAQQSGLWSDERGANLFDGGAPFYDVYETADGRFVSVGALEPRFYAELLERLGLDPEALPTPLDRENWPHIRERLAAIFRSKTRDAWCAMLEGSDACFAPVLTMAEARAHPHNRARRAFVEIEGVMHPAPAPRFSRTRPSIQGPPEPAGAHTDQVLADWGFSRSEIAALRAAQATF
ncbi:MAG: CoA transferase [Myxococcales bacterium]|nr:CoA transferase [Myxococcales bacterium]MDH5566844.1 CoA transferase [Myxococcales bacterium]